MKKKNISDFIACPYCGNDNEYYTKDYVRGTVHWNHSFNGSIGNNSETMDMLPVKQGKVAYCTDCDRKLANI